MVTPTFAAGLGVVVAAGLALSMTTRTVLHFSGPDQGKRCAVPGCVPGTHGGAGTLASAKPGILMPSPLGPGRSAQPTPSFTGGQGSVGPAASHVVVAYQTTQRFSWGFDGKIVISGLPASAANSWRLEFSYPGTRIVEVQGAQWQPTGDDSGVAEPETSAGSGSGPSGGGASEPRPGQGSAGSGGQSSDVVITIEASGTPSTPSGCTLDNAPCSFR
jgi:hypothetical protein